MDVEIYKYFHLDQPFEEKLDDTRTGSGSFNVNLKKETRDWANPDVYKMETKLYPLPPETIQNNQINTPGIIKKYKKWNQSTIFPGTERYIFTYVSNNGNNNNNNKTKMKKKQTTTEYNLIICFDAGNFNVLPTILDNMIHQQRLEPTVAIFVTPGRRPGHPLGKYRDDDIEGKTNILHDDPQRSFEYDSITDTNSQFLMKDLIPFFKKENPNIALTTNPRKRCLCGSSSGAVAAFTACFHRPDQFGLCISHIGSFVNIRGASNFPWIIRNTHKKNIRVFLQSGELDIDNNHGSWPLGNYAMYKALLYAQYPKTDVRFVFGKGTHSGRHGLNMLPQTLEWIFNEATSSKSDHNNDKVQTRIHGDGKFSKL